MPAEWRQRGVAVGRAERRPQPTQPASHSFHSLVLVHLRPTCEPGRPRLASPTHRKLSSRLRKSRARSSTAGFRTANPESEAAPHCTLRYELFPPRNALLLPVGRKLSEMKIRRIFLKTEEEVSSQTVKVDETSHPTYCRSDWKEQNVHEEKNETR